MPVEPSTTRTPFVPNEETSLPSVTIGAPGVMIVPPTVSSHSHKTVAECVPRVVTGALESAVGMAAVALPTTRPSIPIETV